MKMQKVKIKEQLVTIYSYFEIIKKKRWLVKFYKIKTEQQL